MGSLPQNISTLLVLRSIEIVMKVLSMVRLFPHLLKLLGHLVQDEDTRASGFAFHPSLDYLGSGVKYVLIALEKISDVLHLCTTN